MIQIKCVKQSSLILSSTRPVIAYTKVNTLIHKGLFDQILTDQIYLFSSEVVS